MGNKEELMTLVGCLVSTSLEQIDVRYCKAKDPGRHEFIGYHITEKEEILILRKGYAKL